MVEVKQITVKDEISKLREDIKTIKWFLNNANYYRAIMLIYGNIDGDLPDNIKTELERISDGRILVLLGSESYGKPEIIRGEEFIA